MKGISSRKSAAPSPSTGTPLFHDKSIYRRGLVRVRRSKDSYEGPPGFFFDIAFGFSYGCGYYVGPGKPEKLGLVKARHPDWLRQRNPMETNAFLSRGEKYQKARYPREIRITDCIDRKTWTLSAKAPILKSCTTGSGQNCEEASDLKAVYYF
jgi:hypothetical protein